MGVITGPWGFVKVQRSALWSWSPSPFRRVVNEEFGPEVDRAVVVNGFFWERKSERFKQQKNG